MADFSLATTHPVSNNRDPELHLELMTPAGPRRRCHPHFAAGGSFATGVSDFLLKLTDPQLRGPAAHWEGICRMCRETLGVEDLLRARRLREEARECRHGVSLLDHCGACDLALRSYNPLRELDVPVEGWQVCPIGGKAVVLHPGDCMQLEGRPQKMLRGPYRLGLHVDGGDRNQGIYLDNLKIGQCSLVLAWGELWGWSFEELDPNKNPHERLLPLAGPVCNLGCSVTASVHNKGSESVRVSLVLFGHGMDDREWDPGVPSARAVARRLGGADPGRPPRLPAHLSVRSSSGDFEDLEPWTSPVDEPIIGIDDPAYRPERVYNLARAKAREFFDGAHPVTNPIEVFLDVSGQTFPLQAKRGLPLMYAARGKDAEVFSIAAAIARGLGTPSLDVGFVLDGVRYDVRRHVPPPLPPPPPPSAEQLRYFEGRQSDNQATAAYLERQSIEPEEGAWATATDES